MEYSRLSKSLTLRILAFIYVLDEEVNTVFSGDCPPFLKGSVVFLFINKGSFGVFCVTIYIGIYNSSEFLESFIVHMGSILLEGSNVIAS